MTGARLMTGFMLVKLSRSQMTETQLMTGLMPVKPPRSRITGTRLMTGLMPVANAITASPVCCGQQVQPRKTLAYQPSGSCGQPCPAPSAILVSSIGRTA